MKKIDNICAVVVTHNRSKLLKECLSSILNQTYPIDAIYLIDNASTDDTTQMLIKEGYINEITDFSSAKILKKTIIPKNKELLFNYIRLSQNIGGAGGFYEGLKTAFDDGYEWFWLMDDDAEAHPDAIKEISLYNGPNNDILAFANLRKDMSNSTQYWHGWFNVCDLGFNVIRRIKNKEINKDFIEIELSSFVGLLISKKAISLVGFPKRDFFVYYDDFEYCLRLKNKGKILLATKSIIVHKDDRKKEFILSFGGISKRISYNNLWITYYAIRNIIYIKKKNCSVLSLVFMFFWILRKILGVLIFDDKKIRRCLFYLNAYIDGITENFDNNKPRRILYK